MNAEFDWWLLLVGIVAGAGLTWLVLAESTRRDRDIADEETDAEAEWIARSLTDEGTAVEPPTAKAVLRAHRRYLGFPPPDALVEPAELDAAEAAAAAEEPPEQPIERPIDPTAETAAAPARQVPPSPGTSEGRGAA